MKVARRRVLKLAAGSLALPVLSRIAMAETYPSRPAHIIVGIPPGGPTDIGARLIGQWLSDRLGQPFVIENRPGAATNIATEAVAHAPPDGYTLLAAVGSNTINPALYNDLSFNFIRDIAMVGGVYRSALVLDVIPSLPVKTVPELIAYARANPGKVTLASFGTGTVSHIAGELFKMTAGITMVHVPYRGSAPMMTDLLSGQVMAAFDNLPSSIGYIKDGRLRALAVTTAQRWPALPEVPTLSDYQPGFEASTWIALAAPKSTPTAIVDKLNSEINAGLADPAMVARLADLGATPFVISPGELDKMVVV
ncbi:MAG TPA: tripartite tricarboxylate transporter substrate binding protein, partial [Xanthobacteraceae bacterium]|nr:tripartite tricarboxylate transporter substrate binding protein [Xanthobacteraceae bacterium]